MTVLIVVDQCGAFSNRHRYRDCPLSVPSPLCTARYASTHLRHSSALAGGDGRTGGDGRRGLRYCVQVPFGAARGKGRGMGKGSMTAIERSTQQILNR